MVTPGDTSTADRGTPPTQAIIEAIASAEGVDIMELRPPAYEPLYSVVDPEALDLLFNEHPPEENDSDIQVAFTYEGYDVIVYDGGRIDISELNPSDDTVNSVEK